MFNYKTLTSMAAQAREFADLCEELVNEQRTRYNESHLADVSSKDDPYYHIPYEEAHFNTYPFTGTALSGQVRRKSLDLTRALASLRKPG